MKKKNERISSFKNCHPFVTYLFLLKYMFAELLFLLACLWTLPFTKKIVQVSLIQCLRRKLERINKEMQLILQVYGLHILEGRYITDILHATNQ